MGFAHRDNGRLAVTAECEGIEILAGQTVIASDHFGRGQQAEATMRQPMPLDAIPCPSAYVVDRDSLPCGSPRLGQLDNASRPSFQRALGYRPITYRVVTIDRFARSVVMAWAGQELRTPIAELLAGSDC